MGNKDRLYTWRVEQKKIRKEKFLKKVVESLIRLREKIYEFRKKNIQT